MIASWYLHVAVVAFFQVLSCANELGINEVVRECMLYLVQQCNADNAVLHYSIAENNKLPELSQSMLKFIYDRFSEIAVSEHFMYIPAEKLRTIIDDDQLCAKNELEIFDVCVLCVYRRKITAMNRSDAQLVKMT